TINMFDLLGSVRQHLADPNWISPETAISGLLFAGLIFWVFCFSISRYSSFVENYLHTGYSR
ncbi:MAG: amino acid ABC transporter permease, partial [Alphaproteobacteria bacterium]|nr:amino acid ABC transporter permease [Alphaproteobacteria bacterium]